MIKIKKVKINYLNYFNKTVFNKNILLIKSIKNKVNIKINHKKNTTNIVTLRAPKHFKIGRHHYNIILNKMQILFKINTDNFYIPKKLIFVFINNTNNLIIKKNIPKAFSTLINIKITYVIKNFFAIN